MSRTFPTKISLIAAFWFLFSSVAAAYECDQTTYAAAYKQMDLAFKLGILRNDSGAGVFISEAFWSQMNFAQKQAFADNLVCATAGVGRGLYRMRFRSDMTGKELGEWKTGILTVN